METKVQQNNNMANLPAGIIEGTEAFWFDDEKWLIHQGEAMRFNDAPIKLRNMIAEMFLTDKQSRAYLTKIGVTAFSQAFEMWYRCIIGALDQTPDFTDGNLTADAYNHACKDYRCIHRGHFCSLTPGLKNYEVETLVALKLGETIEHTASMLFVSVPGLKSRIEKIKEKLGATNMASMIAKAVEFGI